MSAPNDTSGPHQLGPRTDGSEDMETALLRRVGPLPVSELRKRQVWARLNATPSPSSVWLRPVRLVPIAVFLIAGGAMAYRHYFPPASDSRESARAQQPSAVVLSHEGQRADGEAAPERASKVGTALDSESKAESSGESSRSDSLTMPEPKKGTPPDALPSTEPAKRDLLWEAMEARRSGDLEKMNRLADEYRSEQPTGALDEEALALSLEAAIAKGSPRAQPLAREYLDKYPQGRFATLAKKALKSSSP